MKSIEFVRISRNFAYGTSGLCLELFLQQDAAHAAVETVSIDGHHF